MNILAFFAHPDDETMLSGGLLALLAQQGHAVHYLCATRGEGGEAGEPPLCTLEDLGATRSDEMACAVQALGGASLRFLEYVDPRVGPDNTLYAFTNDKPTLIAEVAAWIDSLQIDVVISHGTNGEYGHPAHKLCHRAAWGAVQQLPEDERPLFYTIGANFEEHPYPRLMNTDDPAHIILDITPVIAQKIQGALCHKTQHALFVRRRSKMWGRQVTVPEVIIPVEAIHRQWPTVEPDHTPSDPFAEELHRWIKEHPGGS